MTAFKKLQVSWNFILSPNLPTKTAINQDISKHLIKFLPELNGVLLSFEILGLAKESTVIGNAPCAFSTIQADLNLNLWIPRKGMICVGRVTRTSADHVALVVHGLFNASIPKSQIGKGFEWKNGIWRDEAAKKDLVDGCFIRFRIDHLIVAHDVLSLEGSLGPSKKINLGYIHAPLPGMISLPRPPSLEPEKPNSPLFSEPRSEERKERFGTPTSSVWGESVLASKQPSPEVKEEQKDKKDKKDKKKEDKKEKEKDKKEKKEEKEEKKSKKRKVDDITPTSPTKSDIEASNTKSKKKKDK